jgi:hypothetical protein
MKAQGAGSGGRILLGDNTGGGAVMLRPIGFLCFGVWFQLDRLVYTQTVDRIFNCHLRKIRLSPQLL